MNAYWKGIAIGLLLFTSPARAQEKPVTRDLKSCIEYARTQNIRIRQSRIALNESLENIEEAKAQRLPSLSFSTAHNYANRSRPEPGDENSYSGTYDLRCR